MESGLTRTILKAALLLNSFDLIVIVPFPSNVFILLLLASSLVINLSVDRISTSSVGFDGIHPINVNVDIINVDERIIRRNFKFHPVSYTHLTLPTKRIV